MKSDDQTPIAAHLLSEAKPAKTPRRSRLIFGLLAGVACLICSGIGGWSLQTILRYLKSEPVDPLATHWPTREENRRELVAAFREELQSADHPDRETIVRFLDEMASYSSTSDQAALRELFDFQRFLRRVRSYPIAQTTSLPEGFETVLRETKSFPVGIKKFQISSIAALSADDFVVSAYAFSEESYEEPYRFWLARNGSNLRLVDYERVITGWSDARYHAVFLTKTDYNAREAFINAHDAINEAMDIAENGDQERALTILASYENFKPPEELHSYWRCLRCVGLAACEDWNAVLTECRKGIEHEELPIFYHYLATLRKQTSLTPDEVLTAAHNYERCTGFDPIVVRARARALRDLGKGAQAVFQYRRLVRFDPESTRDLANLKEILPTANSQ